MKGLVLEGFLGCDDKDSGSGIQGSRSDVKGSGSGVKGLGSIGIDFRRGGLLRWCLPSVFCPFMKTCYVRDVI